MVVKRYYARDMAEAMVSIRKELGPDAVILSSKKVRSKGLAGLLKKKLVEVVVAYNGPDNSKPAKAQETKNPALDADKLDKLAGDIATLQDLVADFTQKINTVEKESLLKLSPASTKLYARLVTNDVEDGFAKEIMLEAQEAAAKNEAEPETVLRQLLLDKMGEPAPIKLKKFKRNIIMLVGPTGVGKTTTLVKLAGSFIADQELKVGLINTDTYRIGAHDQIRTYADIMDVPLHIVYTAEEMASALKEQEDREIVLIDTVGKNSWDDEYKKNLKEIIAASEPDEIMLLVSVNTSRQALKGILDNYAFLGNSRLIITKADEIKAWGNMVNIVNWSKKKLAYLTVGQNVPYDIEEADMNKIINNVLNHGVAND